MNAGFWNERYREPEYAYGTEPNDFLRAYAGGFPKGPVLCLAEGQGRNAVFLAERGHDVTAVDFSPEGLKRAQELAAARGVTIATLECDLSAFVPPRTDYAAVIAIFAHLPPATRCNIHAMVPKILAPGGVFVLEAYTPLQLAYGTGGPKDRSLLMTKAALADELSGLSFEVLREVEREISEGPYHQGLSATVQLFARRPA
jgi:SAM-dependent methyltransferase